MINRMGMPPILNILIRKDTAMLIAASANALSDNETVPEFFEEAAKVFIIETDDCSVVKEYSGENGGAEYLARMVAQSDAEAIACGKFRTEKCFETIALASITRYYAAGMHPVEAACASDRGVLPLTTDYEGGHGCGSHEEDRCAQDMKNIKDL